MKIQSTFKKEALNKKKTEDSCLLTFNKEVKLKKDIEQKTMNLSLVIDVSGSMGGTLQNSTHSNLNHIFMNQPQLSSTLESVSKISLALKSACTLVDNLNNGDFVSIVTFGSHISVIVPSTKITASNRTEIKQSIQSITLNGMTNLHGGWLAGVKEISKNMQDDYLNRCILFTDGQVNEGVTDMDTIATDVLNVQNKGVSCSTFGIGNDFNEDLLQAMAESGGGLSYFIQSDDEFLSHLNTELKGLSSIIGTNVKLTFEWTDNLVSFENFDQYKRDKDTFLLTNLINNVDLSFFFDFDYKNESKKSKLPLGTAILSYTDEHGQPQTEKYEITANMVTDKKWQQLPNNELVVTFSVLNSVNSIRSNMMSEIESGNLDQAKSMLANAESLIGASGLQNERIQKEVDSLSSLTESYDTMDSFKLRKVLSYQSYSSKR